MESNSVGQRFHIGDRVTRKSIFVSTESFAKRYGRITRVVLRSNIKGTKTYYYEVDWSDNKSSEHAQHTLVRAIS